MSLPLLPLGDEAARELARTALDRSFLVEAGAGTGKTSLIVDRIVALVEAGTPLDRIVAITFTEKAAGELKVRVRATLERQATTRARSALLVLERASISTIHAWSASLLRAYPVEAAVDPLFAVLDANAGHALFERCWEEWLGRELSASGSGRVPLLPIPGEGAAWWVGQLQQLARFLVDQRRRLPGAVPDPIPGDHSLALMEAFQRTDLGALEGAINPGDTMVAALEKSRYALEAFIRQQPDERYLTLLGGQRAFDLKNSYERVGNKVNWKGRESELETRRSSMKELMSLAKEAQARALHDLVARVVRWICDGFVPHYEAEKGRLGALDFDDLLAKVAAMMREHPAVRREVRRSVRTLIVDEFQDTDPVQCETAFLLTSENDTSDWTRARPRPGSLFLVGDPKQSIYAFRGADIETYSDARDALAQAGGLLSISTNFRSRPAVLGWVNAVFARLMQPDAKPERWQVPYAALDPSRPAAAVAGAGVHVVRPPIGVDYTYVGQSRDAEARTVAALLRDEAAGTWIVRDRKTGADRPARLGDMVVLLRNRTSSLPAYERAFRAARLPYVVVGGRALWERQEVRALTALCRAVENPYDQVSVVAALKSPFFGASDADLLLWRHTHGGFFPLAEPEGSTPVGLALARLFVWHRDRIATPPYRLIERILTETGGLASFGLKPDGSQRVANLLRLVESARDGGADAFGSPGAPASFRAFVQGLSDRVRELREEAEGAILEDGEEAIRVLTMHAAKGLEFPIVVLGDLSVADKTRDPRFVDESHRSSAPNPGSQARSPHAFAVRMGSQELGVETLGFRDVQSRAAQRGEAEDLRLLYVAATRACDALVVPLFACRARKPGVFYRRLTQEFPALLEGAPGSVLDANDGGPARIVDGLVPVEGDPPVFRVALDELESAMDRLAPPPLDARDADADAQSANIEARRQPRLVEPVTRILDERDGRDGRLAIPAPAGTGRLPFPAPGASPAMSAADEAKAIGVSVHAALELCDLGDEEALGRAARGEAAARRLSSGALARAEAMARGAARLPSLVRARGAARLLREWPFVLRGPRGWLLEGVIDLAWVEDGALVVLDYKTDALAGDHEAAAARAAAHHLQQVQSYALALHRITGMEVKSTVLAFLAGPVEVERPISASDLENAMLRLDIAFSRATVGT